MRLFAYIREKRYNLKYRLQRFMKSYASEDLFSIDYWFQTTFVEMIKEFEKTVIGSPMCEINEPKKFNKEFYNKAYNEILEEVIESKYFSDIKTLEEAKEYFDDDNDKNYLNWRLVLKRIAYCLEQSNDDFCNEKNEYWDELYSLIFKDESSLSNDEIERKNELEKLNESRNIEIDKYKENMKNEAFKLISKYFFNLWD